MPNSLEEKQDRCLDIELNEQSKEHINNLLDEVILQIILDSKEHNDEELRILEKPIFPPNQPVAQLNVPESLVLKLAYQRKQ